MPADANFVDHEDYVGGGDRVERAVLENNRRQEEEE